MIGEPWQAEEAVMTKRVAIVGGGISGIYTAWRLLQQNQEDVSLHRQLSFQIHLYERESRLGGRIRSEKIPGTDFRAELGAMRFRPSHLILNTLLAELDVPICDFELPPPTYYVRGRRLTSAEEVAGNCSCCQAGGPFHLRDNERGQSATELVRFAIDGVLRALNFPRLSQGQARQLKMRIRKRYFNKSTWELIKEHGIYQGLQLYNIGFWNLLQHFLSNEAYVMVHDMLSLESILGNWNAAEAIPWFLADFASDQYSMVRGGLSSVADKLKDRIDPETNSSLQGRIELRKGFIVHSLSNEHGMWTLTHSKDQQENHDEYDIVILALPKRPLRELRVTTADPQFEWPPKWVNWVKGHRMFKLFLLYESAWWMGDSLPGHDTGRVFTDLPLRQIYYFSPSWMAQHGHHDVGCEEESAAQGDQVDKGGKALIMASYSDEHYVSFWEPMLNPNPEWGLMVDSGQPYLQRSAKITDRDWEKIPTEHADVLARKRMVDKVQLLLTEIHGREVPQPILGMVRDWDAGWHTWIVHSKPWTEEIKKARVQPLPPNLFLCGEAYSNEQGWIEGALKSAEQVLLELRVLKPAWTKGRNIQNFHKYVSE